jgi:hypothetical protein
MSNGAGGVTSLTAQELLVGKKDKLEKTYM